MAVSKLEGGGVAQSDSFLPEDTKIQTQSTAAMETVIENAKLATEKEQQMTLLQGIKLYPKAVAWSLLISTCIVMEGYDICLVNNFYAFPAFNRKYGEQMPDGTYQVPARVRRSAAPVTLSSIRLNVCIVASWS